MTNSAASSNLSLMKPSDIIPGQKYRNHTMPGFVYMGAKRFLKSPKESHEFELFLVIVEAMEDSFPVLGTVVCAPEFCVEGYWEDFYIDGGEVIE